MNIKSRINRVIALLCIVITVFNITPNCVWADDIVSDNSVSDDSVSDDSVDNNTENNDEEKETYIVSFDSDGGETIDSQEVKEGELVTKPSDPTKDGFTFDCWKNGDEEWDFENDIVNSDITLVASYTEDDTEDVSDNSVSENETSISLNDIQNVVDTAADVMEHNKEVGENPEELEASAPSLPASVSDNSVSDNSVSDNVAAPKVIQTKKSLKKGALRSAGSGTKAYLDYGMNERTKGARQFDVNTTIKSFRRTDEAFTSETTVSTSDSPYPIYWRITDDGVLELYTEADTIEINGVHGGYLFSCMKGLESVDFTGFGGSPTKTYCMFYQCSSLRSVDLSNFNLSSVTDMAFMFNGCVNIEEITADFSGANVTYVHNSFSDCKKLKTLNLSGLGTSNAEDMENIFSNCESLESLDISSFDTSSATDIHGMFYNCKALRTINMGSWDTSKVNDFSHVFYYCESLTSLDINSWDTRQSHKFTSTFCGCSGLTSLNLSNWRAPIAFDYNFAFYGCSNLTTLNISGWDTPEAITMQGMFEGCKKLQAVDVSSFQTGKVTNFRNMFRLCYKLNSVDVSGFDTKNATTLECMFEGVPASVLAVENFNTSKVTNMRAVFWNCKNIESLDLSKWDTSKVTDMTENFKYCGNLKNLDISGWDFSKLETDKKYPESFSNYNTKLEVVKMENVNFGSKAEAYASSLFSGITTLKTVSLKNANISGQEYTSSMFSGCSSLESVDLSGLDFSNVINMENMFSRCTSLSSIDWGEGCNCVNNVNMYNMFSGCSSLESIDTSVFQTPKVENIGQMFFDCDGLTELSIDFDTSSVTYAYGLCQNSDNLETLDLSGICTDAWLRKKTDPRDASISYYSLSSEYMIARCPKLTTVITPALSRSGSQKMELQGNSKKFLRDDNNDGKPDNETIYGYYTDPYDYLYITVDENAHIYKSIDQFKVTVTFRESKDATEDYATMVLQYGDKFSGTITGYPSNPTKSGTSFKFWYYVDDDGKEKIAEHSLKAHKKEDGSYETIDERFVVKKDTILYPRWDNETHVQHIYSVVPIDTHNSAKIRQFADDPTYFEVTMDLTVEEMESIVTFDYDKADEKYKDKTFLGWYSTQMAEYGTYKKSEDGEQVKNCALYAVFSPIVVNIYDDQTNEIAKTLTFDEPSGIYKNDLSIADMPDHTNDRAEDGYYAQNFYVKTMVPGYIRAWESYKVGDMFGTSWNSKTKLVAMVYQDFDLEVKYHQPYVRMVTISAFHSQMKLADFDEKVTVSDALYNATEEAWKNEMIKNCPDDAVYSDIAEYKILDNPNPDDTDNTSSRWLPYDPDKTLRENLADNNMQIPLDGVIHIAYAPKDIIFNVNSDFIDSDDYYYSGYGLESLKEKIFSLFDEKVEASLAEFEEHNPGVISNISEALHLNLVKTAALYLINVNKYGNDPNQIAELMPEMAVLMNSMDPSTFPPEMIAELEENNVDVNSIEDIVNYLYKKYNLVAEWTDDVDAKDYISTTVSNGSTLAKRGLLTVKDSYDAGEGAAYTFENTNYILKVPDEISIYDASFTIGFETPPSEMFDKPFEDYLENNDEIKSVAESEGRDAAYEKFKDMLKDPNGEILPYPADLDKFGNEVSVTFETNELVFEEQGFVLKLYKDADYTIPFDSVTLTDACNTTVYLKLEETSSVHKLGTTQANLNFSIDAKY